MGMSGNECGIFVDKIVMKTSFVLLSILSVVFASPLWASVALDLGMGARASGMGGAYTAVADDFSAVFYNPAGLAQIRRAELSITSIYAQPTFTMSGRDMVNLYHRITALRGIGGGVTHLDIPPIEMERSFGVTIGLAMDLGYLAGTKNGYLGLGVYLPYEWMARSVAVSTTATFPHFPMYVARLASPVINVAAAWEIRPDLSIGVGVDILSDMVIDTYVAVTLDFENQGIVGGVNDPVVVPVVNREIEADAAPHVGILWRPAEGLRLGLSYRGKLIVNLEGAEEFTIYATSPLSGERSKLISVSATPIVFANFFTPHAVSGGIAYEWRRWLFSLDLTWNKWSEFIDGSGRRPSDPFHDTFVPRMGVERRLTDDLRVTGGYFFQASPVPDQPRESNYLDFTKHVFSVGWAYTFPRPVLRKRKLSLSGYLQWHFLEERRIEKVDTGVTVERNGVEFSEYGPDYTISGSMFHAGIGVVFGF